MISMKNECAAWRLIDMACDEALKKYPTTLKKDLAFLKKDDQRQFLTVNKRNCIDYRKREKVILHFLKECAAQVLKVS